MQFSVTLSLQGRPPIPRLWKSASRPSGALGRLMARTNWAEREHEIDIDHLDPTKRADCSTHCFQSGAEYLHVHVGHVVALFLVSFTETEHVARPEQVAKPSLATAAILLLTSRTQIRWESLNGFETQDGVTSGAQLAHLGLGKVAVVPGAGTPNRLIGCFGPSHPGGLASSATPTGQPEDFGQKPAPNRKVARDVSASAARGRRRLHLSLLAVFPWQAGRQAGR